jgi:hypothetical protein
VILTGTAMGTSDVTQFLAVYDLRFGICVVAIAVFLDLNLEPLFLVGYLEEGILPHDLQFNS